MEVYKYNYVKIQKYNLAILIHQEMTFVPLLLNADIVRCTII